MATSRDKLKKKVQKWKAEYGKVAEENFELTRALESANERLQTDAAIIRDLVAVIDKLTDGVHDADDEPECGDAAADDLTHPNGEECILTSPLDGPVISP